MFETLALALYVVYLAVAFVLRTAIQVRRTGDSGMRGLSGRAGGLEWWAGVLFVVAIVLGLLGPVAGLLGLSPIGLLDHGLTRAIGAAVTVTGIGFTFIAQLRMGEQWRIGVDVEERTTLVTGGLFALMRNPIFTAMGLTALGLVLIVPNLVALTGLIALLVALEVQVRLVEEPYLRAVHGRDYLDYAARTGRFLPKLGLLRPDG